ncbi:MAG: hypothetical protein ACOH13_02085 [Flavobacteriales bacterium]
MDRTIARKSVLVFGHVTFIVLFILAWENAFLRTSFGDTAFQVFKWVNNPGWTVEAHRYSAILPQAAVKFLRLFNAPLPVLLLTASVTHVLVAYAVFLVCLLWLKAPHSAMAAALAAVLCTRLTFYGPVLEANYLLCYPFLFFALLERRGKASIGIQGWVALFVAAACTLLVHPLGWLILLFGVVYLWSLGQLQRKVAVVICVGLVIAAGTVRLLFPPTVYEQAQYAQLENSFASLSLGTKWASWDFLVGHTFTLTTNYLPALVVFVIVVAMLVVRKFWKPALVLTAGVLGFLLLALVTFRSGDTAIMMDRAFLPVATLISLPAVFLLWDLRGRQAGIGILLFAIVLFVKLRDISFASRPAQEQYSRAEKLLADMRAQAVMKGELSTSELESRSIDVNWSFPYSTLLISSMKGPAHSMTMRIERDSLGLTEETAGPAVGLELEQTISVLDTGYFRLPRTPYVQFPIAPHVP